MISRYGVGVDSVDLKAATDLGMIVANVPDYCVDEVANQTLSMILTLIRKTAFFDQKVKSGQWDFHLGIPIHRTQGKILGLIGCGKIGIEVAKRISSFGVKVIAFDPYIEKAHEGIELKDLDTVLKESDFISIHCPLNDSTRHLIGVREFKKMEKKPILINTSRGPIIDEKVLIQSLKEGLISGAGLDVLEKEPPDSENPLLKMENVILSPHIGFYSEESIRELKRKDSKECLRCPFGKVAKFRRQSRSERQNKGSYFELASLMEKHMKGSHFVWPSERNNLIQTVKGFPVDLLKIYPKSFCSFNGLTYGLIRTSDGKKLVVTGEKKRVLSDDFRGKCYHQDFSLKVCDLS